MIPRTRRRARVAEYQHLVTSASLSGRAGREADVDDLVGIKGHGRDRFLLYPKNTLLKL